MTPATPSAGRRSWLLDAACIGMPTVLFAALALTSLSSRPMWRDEMATREFALLPWKGLLQATHHVDLILLPYYALMHVAVRMGDTVVAMRLPSALAGIAVVALVAVSGRLLWGRGAAVVGGLLLATNGVFLGETAAQARPGALAQLFLMIAAVATIRIVQQGVTTGRWLCVLAGGVAAVLMQLMSVLLLLPFGLLLVRRSAYRRSLASAGVVVTVVAAAFVAMTHGQAAQTHWIRIEGPRKTLLRLQLWSGMHHEWIALVIVVAAVAAQLIRRRVDPAWWVWCTALVAPPLALYLVSFVNTPLFYPRYAVLFAPALAVLLAGSVALVAGMATARITGGAARATVAAAMGLLLLLGNTLDLGRNYRTTEGLDNIATIGALLDTMVAPGDTVVFLSGLPANGWTYGVAYYTGDTAMQRDLLSRLPSGTGWTRSVRRVTDIDPLRTTAAGELRGRVWVIEFTQLTEQLPGLRDACTRSRHGLIDGTPYQQFVCREPVRVGQ